MKFIAMVLTSHKTEAIALSGLMGQYLAMVGVGQYKRQGFAKWVSRSHPEVAAAIVDTYLKALAIENERQREDGELPQ